MVLAVVLGGNKVMAVVNKQKNNNWARRRVTNGEFINSEAI